jgi:hypothetical protein
LSTQDELRDWLASLSANEQVRWDTLVESGMAATKAHRLMVCEKEMKDFVSYFAQFDSTFPDRLVPATSEDIQNLQALAKARFPVEYHVFLSRMGKTPMHAFGPMFEGTSIGLDGSMEFYRDPPVPIPDDLVHLTTLDESCEFFLDASESTSGERSVLLLQWAVNEDTGEYIKKSSSRFVIARNLLQYLYKEAFLKLRYDSLPFQATIREMRETVETKPDADHQSAQKKKFMEIATHLGFDAVPTMDGDGDLVFFNRSDAAILLYSQEVAADSVEVAAEQRKICVQLSNELAEALGLFPFAPCEDKR